jgi:2'-5' RNA ligase
MPDTTRTFVAIPLSDSVRAALDRLRTRIQPDIAGARWVEPRNYHVTMHFLGDVPHADLVEVCQAVAVAASHAPSFELSVQRLGAFPDARRPRVLWAGLTGPGLDAMRRLHETLAKTLRDIGYSSDDRFSPHITLARFKPGKKPSPDLTALIEHHAPRWQAGTLAVTDVVTYSSMRGAEGSEYTALSRAPLGAPTDADVP